MMLLDFKAVQAGRRTQTFTVAPDDPVLRGFFAALSSPLQVLARVREQPHRSFVVDLRVTGEVEVPCRRCLEPARQAVDERSVLLAQVRDERAPADEGEEEREVMSLRSLHDQVELGPYVRDALFLAADAYALCTPKCRGLCPSCGEDLNAGACACTEEAVAAEPRGVLRIRGAESLSTPNAAEGRSDGAPEA